MYRIQQQLPRLRSCIAIHTITRIGIFGKPFFGCWFGSNPWQFEYHIINNRVILDTFGSGTYTLHITSCQCIIIALHCFSDAAMQTCTPTEVTQLTIDEIVAGIMTARPIGVTVGEQVESDKAVRVGNRHRGEACSIRQTLPILYNPFRVIYTKSSFFFGRHCIIIHCGHYTVVYNTLVAAWNITFVERVH